MILHQQSYILYMVLYFCSPQKKWGQVYMFLWPQFAQNSKCRNAYIRKHAAMWTLCAWLTLHIHTSLMLPANGIRTLGTWLSKKRLEHEDLSQYRNGRMLIPSHIHNLNLRDLWLYIKDLNKNITSYIIYCICEEQLISLLFWCIVRKALN